MWEGRKLGENWSQVSSWHYITIMWSHYNLSLGDKLNFPYNFVRMCLPSFWPSTTKSQHSFKTYLKINFPAWNIQSRPDENVKWPVEFRICRWLQRKQENWISENGWITIMNVVSRVIRTRKYWLFTYVLGLCLFVPLKIQLPLLTISSFVLLTLCPAICWPQPQYYKFLIHNSIPDFTYHKKKKFTLQHEFGIP